MTSPLTIPAANVAWLPEGRRPTPKQWALLKMTYKREVFYGGQVGGGKSDGLLMDALQFVWVPGYAALLLRKRMVDLNQPGALISRSLSWNLKARGATYNANDHRWTFPSGSSLSFGYIRNDEDVVQYQSAEFQFIGFDELTQFSEYQYTYMASRLRGPEAGILGQVPLRMRGASNPGNRGHEWVKQRFITPDKSDPKRKNRAYIPSGIVDNPHIGQENYREMLALLPPQTRKQLEDGDWDAREEGNWVIEDPAYVDEAVRTAMEWIAEGWITEPEDGVVAGGIDWGEHTAAYCIMPLPNGVIYIPPSETIGEHEEPGAVSNRIIDNVVKFGFPVSGWRYDAAGAQSMRTFMATARKRLATKQNSTQISFASYKRETMWYLRLLFRRTAQGETSRIILIHPDNKELIRQLKIWERRVDKEGREAEDTTKIDDHSCDAMLAGVAPIARKNRVWVEDQLKAIGSDVRVVAA